MTTPTVPTGNKVTTIHQDFDGRETGREVSYGPAILAGDGKVYQFPGESEARQYEAAAREAGGPVPDRLVPVTPAVARPLYSLELHLAALLDTEELVTEDQEREYALELHTTLLAAKDKRDRVGQFLAHLEGKEALVDAEIKRLQGLKASIVSANAKLTDYVTRVIESLGKETGKDGKERYRKLEGNTTVLSLRGCDKRAEVTDELAVPAKYKRTTVTLPAEMWELVCDSVDMDLRDQVLAAVKPVTDVSTSLVKADLKAGVDVPGA